jgi:hypothetical protein
MWAGHLGVRVGDQATTASQKRREHIFREFLEIAMNLDAGQDAIPRLFEAKEQAFAYSIGFDDMALPEALLGPRGSNDEQPSDPQTRNRREQASEDGRSREREYQGQPTFRRWVPIEFDAKIQTFRVEADDLRASELPTNHSDA